MNTNYFKEAAKREIKELEKVVTVENGLYELILNHKFKDSKIKEERDTYAIMFELYENSELGPLRRYNDDLKVGRHIDKSFLLSCNEEIEQMELTELIKLITNGLESHKFTNKDEVHLYICKNKNHLMIQNKAKFDLFEEMKMKIGVFEMRNIYSTSQDGQKAFFTSRILPKIAELRAGLLEYANS